MEKSMFRIITFLFLITHLILAQANKGSAIDFINKDIALVKSFEDQMISGSFVVVGGDPNGCHFSNIQDAIDAAQSGGETEIRIATNKTYNENLFIDDISVSLIGGYTDCLAAGLPFGLGTNQVVINGGNIASVLKITGSSQRNNILLRNLRFIEGLGLAPNTDSAGGGILSYNADVSLTLRNVDARSNDADYGAGIAIIGGDTDLIMRGSLVINNLAKYGAGIFCSGGSSSVVMIEDSGIIANVANGVVVNGDGDINGRAGGIYVSGCYFGMHSGSGNGGTIGIASNIAFGNGGGIYAEAGATVLLNGQQVCASENCIGDDNNPVNITQNVAGFGENSYGSGGGIYATDVSTTVTIYAGLIKNNTAGSYGGGIYVYDSELTIGRLHKACWDEIRCNYFDGNTTTYRGGAIQNFGGNVDVSFSYFENNKAVTGAAISSSGYLDTEERTRIEGSVINHNGDATSESIIYSQGNIAIDFIHTTIADNTLMSSSYGVSIFRSVYSTGGPDVSIHASIVDNNNTQILSHDMINYPVDISCIIANETDSISASNNLINFSEGNAGGAFISMDNPAFIDRNNFDYHLAQNSPAIDYCHTPTHTTVLPKDIDYEDRGYDDPNHNDLSLFTFYDIGADESYLSDIIFIDGFD